MKKLKGGTLLYIRTVLSLLFTLVFLVLAIHIQIMYPVRSDAPMLTFISYLLSAFLFACLSGCFIKECYDTYEKDE